MLLSLHNVLTGSGMSYLQEAVSAAQEVSSLHDDICSEDQLVLTESRLIWTRVNRLGGCKWRQRGTGMWLLEMDSSGKHGHSHRNLSHTNNWNLLGGKTSLSDVILNSLMIEKLIRCLFEKYRELDKHRWHFTTIVDWKLWGMSD